MQQPTTSSTGLELLCACAPVLFMLGFAFLVYLAGGFRGYDQSEEDLEEEPGTSAFGWYVWNKYHKGR